MTEEAKMEIVSIILCILLIVITLIVAYPVSSAIATIIGISASFLILVIGFGMASIINALQQN